MERRVRDIRNTESTHFRQNLQTYFGKVKFTRRETVQAYRNHHVALHSYTHIRTPILRENTFKNHNESIVINLSPAVVHREGEHNWLYLSLDFTNWMKHMNNMRIGLGSSFRFTFRFIVI